MTTIVVLCGLIFIKQFERTLGQVFDLTSCMSYASLMHCIFVLVSSLGFRLWFLVLVLVVSMWFECLLDFRVLATCYARVVISFGLTTRKLALQVALTSGARKCCFFAWGQVDKWSVGRLMA